MAEARSVPMTGAGRSFAGAASAAPTVSGAATRVRAPTRDPAAVAARPRRDPPIRVDNEIKDMVSPEYSQWPSGRWAGIETSH